MTYSPDFSRKVLEIKKAEIAQRFKVAVARVIRWNKTSKAKRTRNKQSKIDMAALKQDVELCPDTYHYKRAPVLV